jgi:hypothetical protein
MASDVEKAAKHRDVYELERLSYVYEDNRTKLREIGVALEQIVPQLDPKKKRDELAQVTKALDCSELRAARAAARTALGWPAEESKGAPSSPTGRAGGGSGRGGTCLACGRPAQAGWTVCPQCGTPLDLPANEAADWIRAMPHELSDLEMMQAHAEAERVAESAAENYEPASIPLRAALGFVRAAGFVLSAIGGLIIFFFAGCLDEAVEPPYNWAVDGIGIACLAAGILLLRANRAARKRSAIREGAYTPDDLAR